VALTGEEIFESADSPWGSSGMESRFAEAPGGRSRLRAIFGSTP